jgi:hypothetical protein
MTKDRNFSINKHVFFNHYSQPVYTAACICILNGQYKNRDRNFVEQYFGNTDGNKILHDDDFTKIICGDRSWMEMVLQSWVCFTLKQAESYNVGERLKLHVYWSHTVLTVESLIKKGHTFSKYIFHAENIYSPVFMFIYIVCIRKHNEIHRSALKVK